MLSIGKIWAAGRRAGLMMTVAVIGVAGLSISVSAQGLTGQEVAAPVADQAVAPVFAPQAAPAAVSVRQAVTEVVQQQSGDAGPVADAPPADAEPAKAAVVPAPVVSQGHRRQVFTQPTHNTYRAPVHVQRHAFAPTPQYGYRHVVRPQHFSYGHAQPHFSTRSHGHSSHGPRAYAPSHRSFQGAQGFSRH